MNKKKLGVSAVIGVILMVVVTLVIATVVYLYVADGLTSPEERLRQNMQYELEQINESCNNCNCSLSEEYINGWNDAVNIIISYLGYDNYNVTNNVLDR